MLDADLYTIPTGELTEQAFRHCIADSIDEVLRVDEDVQGPGDVQREYPAMLFEGDRGQSVRVACIEYPSRRIYRSP